MIAFQILLTYIEFVINLLPSLDAHAHFDPHRTPEELVQSGAVLAMALSLDEAAYVINRCEPWIAWGVGCHPRKITAQETFEPKRFRQMVEKTAIVGEIGLDTGSCVPLDKQLFTFRQALEVVTDLPRLVSIHSYREPGWFWKSFAEDRLPYQFCIGGPEQRKKRSMPLPWGVISRSTRQWLANPNFASGFHSNVCWSKATMAGLTRPQPSPAGSNGWNTWLASCTGWLSRQCGG